MAISTSSSELVSSAEDHGNRYVEVFNSGDLDRINAMYADDAVSVWEPGQPLTGEARKAALAESMARKPKMTATIRESHVTSTAALLVVDWFIDIPADEDGEPEHLEGVGIDVLRRGADGEWRFAIDNPYGDPS
ncbi:YybH family protein [Streptomyces sp. NPDC051217]|uniref:YybH family protein n=1 Tax=Streptomyces sp. NPDC051217 TaxID=3365644 RepID=UPI003798005E